MREKQVNSSQRILSWGQPTPALSFLSRGWLCLYLFRNRVPSSFMASFPVSLCFPSRGNPPPPISYLHVLPWDPSPSLPERATGHVGSVIGWSIAAWCVVVAPRVYFSWMSLGQFELTSVLCLPEPSVLLRMTCVHTHTAHSHTSEDLPFYSPEAVFARSYNRAEM